MAALTLRRRSSVTQQSLWPVSPLFNLVEGERFDEGENRVNDR